MARRQPMSVLLLALGLVACGGAPEQDEALLNTEPMQPANSTATAPEDPAPAEVPASPANVRAGQPAVPPSPPASQPRIAIVAEGTLVTVALSTTLNSGTAAVGDRFEAEVTEPIAVEGEVVIPSGSRIRGLVDAAHAAKKGSGHGSLTLRFDRLVLPDGQEVELQAGLSQETAGKKKRNAAIIGGSAAGGAILGRVVGDDTKDAAIGAAVAGAIATGVVMAQDGAQVELPAGTLLDLVLEAPTVVPLPSNLS
ncbi:MAG: TrbI/VirB10 family protein [Acidobacteriota bacterium]